MEKRLPDDEIDRLYEDANAHIFQRWEPSPVHESPIVTKAEGVYFWDAKGKKYFDLMSQLFNVNLGLGNRKVIDAVKSQLDELSYASPSYFTVPKIKLAKRLAEITADDLAKCFFSNSGAEANETAIKIAQAYKGASKVIGFWDAYHGSTYATVSVGGSIRTKFPGLSVFEEFKHVPPPYCYHCPFNQTYPECDLFCADFIGYTVEKEGEKSVAAFMAEPVCSWAGQVVPPDGYWEKVRKICDEKNVLLIFDEVMTGFARTGKMFGYEHWNMVPDVETYAKGITSAYVPLGCTIVTKKVAEHFDEKGFPHSYTYSGHPLACAAALAAIDCYIKENLVSKAATMGKYLKDELNGMQERVPTMGDIRGLGLFIGVELVANAETRETFLPRDLTPEQMRDPELNPVAYIYRKLKERRLVIGLESWGDYMVLRIMPALTITKEQIDEGLKMLEEILVEVEKKFDLPKKT